MIIFLYGPDDYRRLQKKQELLAEFRKKRSDLGVGFFDMAAKDWRDGFDEFSRSQSLFESSRLAVMENAFEMEAKPLAAFLKPFVDDKSITLLLSEHDKPVKALALLLEKPTISQKFENLEGPELISFIANEVKKNGAKIMPSAAQFLATVYASNSWALATELQKLSAFKSTIERKDIDEFDLEAAPNYWMLLNGMKSFDVRTRLSTLEKLFSMSDPAAKVFNILAAQAGQKTAQFAELDFMVKSGKMEYEEAILEIVIGN